jgi:solute carrier family 25 protein 44
MLDVRDAALEWDQLDHTRFFAYSALFSFAMDGTLHPLEVIKTRLQVQGQPHVLSSFSAYGSFRDACVTMARQEGARGELAAATAACTRGPRSHHRVRAPPGFVKGLAPAASASIPVQCVYFGSYEYSRFVLSRYFLGGARSGEHAHNEAAEFLIDAAAGAVGEIASGAFWVPADLVSQRLMLQGPDRSKHLYSGMSDAVRKIWHAEGVRGFYVGFGASLLTCIPNSAAQWGMYEYTKKQLYRHWWWPQNGQERGDGSHVVNLISAVTAGIFGASISTPFDVIRVRKQAEGLSTTLLGAGADADVQRRFHSSRVYRGSTFSAMRHLVAEVGWTGEDHPLICSRGFFFFLV